MPCSPPPTLPMAPLGLPSYGSLHTGVYPAHHCDAEIIHTMYPPTSLDFPSPHLLIPHSASPFIITSEHTMFCEQSLDAHARQGLILPYVTGAQVWSRAGSGPWVFVMRDPTLCDDMCMRASPGLQASWFWHCCRTIPVACACWHTHTHTHTPPLHPQTPTRRGLIPSPPPATHCSSTAAGVPRPPTTRRPSTLHPGEPCMVILLNAGEP